jgi:ABC-type lipoprotein release transport system permease subunit
VIAVFSGFIGEARRGIEAASPHLLLTGLRDGSDFLAFQPLLEQIDGVEAVAPRVTHYGMLVPHGGKQVVQRTNNIASGNSAASERYLMLLGIDPSREAKTTDFVSWLRAVANKANSRSDMRPYVVQRTDRPFAVSPEKIARASRLLTGTSKRVLGDQPGFLLGVFRLENGDEILPGQRVDVFSARYDAGIQEIKPIMLNRHCNGAYHTGHRLLDLSVCMLDIETLRDALGCDPLSERELITDVAIRVKDGVDRRVVAAAIEAVAASLGGGQALDYEQQNKTYLGAVDQERALMKIVLFAVMLVAGFLIFATLYMMVTQKIKDIGILTSMGATPGGIGAVFVLGGLAVGLAGCVLGGVSGLLSAFYLNDIDALLRRWSDDRLQIFPAKIYSLDAIPIDLDPAWIAQVIGGALLLSLLVSWLPARKAARLDPVKALMHE